MNLPDEIMKLVDAIEGYRKMVREAYIRGWQAAERLHEVSPAEMNEIYQAWWKENQ